MSQDHSVKRNWLGRSWFIVVPLPCHWSLSSALSVFRGSNFFFSLFLSFSFGPISSQRVLFFLTRLFSTLQNSAPRLPDVVDGFDVTEHCVRWRSTTVIPVLRVRIGYPDRVYFLGVKYGDKPQSIRLWRRRRLQFRLREPTDWRLLLRIFQYTLLARLPRVQPVLKRNPLLEHQRPFPLQKPVVTLTLPTTAV